MIMASRKKLLVWSIVFIIVVLAIIQETSGKGARSSRSRVTKKTKTKTQKTSTRREQASVVKTFHSSVSYKQTKTKTTPFKNRFLTAAAFGVVSYSLLNNPIYSRHYRPFYETSNIAIPKRRALRIKTEKYTVETKNGSQCLNGNLTQYDKRKMVNVITTISYVKVSNKTVKSIPSVVNYTGTIQTNLSVSADAINDYVTNIEIRITFNETVLENATPNTTMDLTNCTVLVYKSEAYVVESSAFKKKLSFVLLLLTPFGTLMVLK